PSRWLRIIIKADHQSICPGQQIIQKLKRHSDGTFTSDLINYIDKTKAKNFVKWLTSTNGKRY
uniref:Glucagon / GIP / secretin / VIP family domain-containing protein n=1 Tax=Gouania willdenowi TaxID=441366 RepID=A0A8C5D395_GOUWI